MHTFGILTVKLIIRQVGKGNKRFYSIMRKDTKKIALMAVFLVCLLSTLMLIGACASQAHLEYIIIQHKNTRAVDIQFLIFCKQKAD